MGVYRAFSFDPNSLGYTVQGNTGIADVKSFHKAILGVSGETI